MRKAWGYLTISSLLSLTLIAPAQANSNTVTVFAAASLTNALQDIAKQYNRAQKVNIVSSFASSSTLARQIDAGAPADLFISADQKWMDYAAAKDNIQPDTRVNLLENSLVLIAPQASPLKNVTLNSQTNWLKLLDGGRLAVGDPDHVPAGIYAKESLQKLGAWSSVADKLAPAEDVRSALALVERDEVPLGIVYGSDAVVSKGVKVIGEFPAQSHQKVEYPAAIVKGRDTPVVSAFFHYLQGPEAANVFKQYGFTTPE